MFGRTWSLAWLSSWTSKRPPGSGRALWSCPYVWTGQWTFLKLMSAYMDGWSAFDITNTPSVTKLPSSFGTQSKYLQRSGQKLAECQIDCCPLAITSACGSTRHMWCISGISWSFTTTIIIVHDCYSPIPLFRWTRASQHSIEWCFVMPRLIYAVGMLLVPLNIAFCCLAAACLSC